MGTAVAENRVSERESSYPRTRSWSGSGATRVRHWSQLARPEGEFVRLSNISSELEPVGFASEWTPGKWIQSIANTPSDVIDIFEAFERSGIRRVFISHVFEDEGLGLTLGSVDVNAFGEGVIGDLGETLNNLLYSGQIRWPEEFYSPRPVQPNLEAALSDLEDIGLEARDAGYLTPSSVAINNARYVVNEMHRIRSLRYHIYPMPDGEVAIDGGEKGTRIGVFCYPDGEVQYVGWVNGECIEEHSPEARLIPSEFLQRALSELESN